jgi:glycogen synthase
MNTNADMLFEVSWEITNKCGGIYTVITSKSNLMKKYYTSYFTIGPLFDKLPIDFTKEDTPSELSQIFAELSNQGIRCVYGTWNISGTPKTILVDARASYSNLDNVKKTLWDLYGVDTLNCAYDFNEPMLWSWAVGILLQKIGERNQGKKIVAHLHEWLAGFALLYLKMVKSSIRTVFTTHATMLGRTIVQNNEKLYEIMKFINPIEKARSLGIIDKFSTEKACALNSTIFTTVSDFTADECELFFGRKPDVLPNGLSVDEFPNFEQASFNHIVAKQKLKKIVKSYFYPYYLFDLDNTSFFYFGGRYEFLTKGLNVLPIALGKLNNYLKHSSSNKTIVVFLFVAMRSKGIKREVLENKNNFKEINDFLETVSKSIGDKLLHACMEGKEPENLLLTDEENILKIKSFKLKREGLPPLCTHTLPYDENNDALLNELRKNDLFNRAEDKVKVLMVPEYVDGSDGLFDMPYYNIINACHLGLFPSYYEPWGYTPLESMAMGVPAITTDQSGFGKFISGKLTSSHNGVFLYQWQRNLADTANAIFELMKNYALLETHARVACKMNAHKLTSVADWNNLIVNYIKAHNKALE